MVALNRRLVSKFQADSLFRLSAGVRVPTTAGVPDPPRRGARQDASEQRRREIGRAGGAQVRRLRSAAHKHDLR